VPFIPGELISKYNTTPSNTQGHCVVVDRDEDNYTLYNNSLKCLQKIAVPVVEGLYNIVSSRRWP